MGGVIIALAVGLIAASRLAPVQDALLRGAIKEAMAPRHAALFDGDGLKIVFCGTGSPLPSKKRAQTCTAIFAGDRFFLVDAGTGSWENLQAGGVPAAKLAGIFLTHFHSDHIGDLSEANLASWVGGRPAPLAVYGPEGVERVVAGENEALALDSLYRTAHHGDGVAPAATAGLSAISFDGAAAAVVYEDGGLKVTAFPVKHDPVKPAVGYRFDYQGRSVVVSGDTAYSESLVANARGVDLLIHEAQSSDMVKMMGAAAAKAGNQRLAQIFSDILSYHATPADAARAANDSAAEWLVLSHLTPAPDNTMTQRIFLRGVGKVRRGKVRIAEDCDVVLLSASGGVSFGRL